MEHPIATSGSLVQKTGITPATVNKAPGHLEQIGIVEELTARKRNRLFSYADYIEIMSRGTELPGRQANSIPVPGIELDVRRNRTMGCGEAVGIRLCCKLSILVRSLEIGQLRNLCRLASVVLRYAPPVSQRKTTPTNGIICY